MCCSSTAAHSPMAEYLKSHSPQELWKAALKPADPLKREDPAQILLDSADGAKPLQAAKTPGTGLLIDTTA